MKLCRLLLLIAIPISIVSCKNSVKNHVADKLSINLDSLERNFPFNSMFPFERMVFLESSKDSKISDIHRIFDIDSLYVIWDKQNSSVYVHNKNGKYLNRIGAKGHAEHEYVNLDDVYINSKEKKVCMLDNASHKILCFGYNGKYESTIKIKEWAIGFAIEEEFVWLESNGQNSASSLLLKTDVKSGDVIESYFPMKNDGRIPIKSEKTFFTNSEGEILFSSPYLNTIYKIDNGNITPLVMLDFGLDALDDSDLTNESYISKLQEGNYTGHIRNVYRCKDYMFISFLKYKNGTIENYYAIYNFTSKECYIYDDTLLHNPKLPIFPTADIIGVGTQNIVFSIDPSLLENDDLLKFPNIENLETDLTQLNPILIIYNVP